MGPLGRFGSPMSDPSNPRMGFFPFKDRGFEAFIRRDLIVRLRFLASLTLFRLVKTSTAVSIASICAILSARTSQASAVALSSLQMSPVAYGLAHFALGDFPAFGRGKYLSVQPHTKPITPAGVAALIQYILDDDLVDDESYWHMAALRSAVAALNNMSATAA